MASSLIKFKIESTHMSRSIGNCIADSLQLCLGYADRLLTDIPEDQFAKYASPGGETVESNHPAFILGHLSIYPSRVLDHLGVDATAITASDEYQKLFSPDAKCENDPEGTIYPAASELIAAFKTNYGAALEALRAADDSAMEGVNPSEGRMRELFPTIGSALGFYCGGHVMMHMGQLSAWRRMNGMAPA